MDGQLKTEPWVFSFTQLSLYRLCPRRWFYRYVLGIKEPQNEAMAYSSLLVHGVLEGWLKGAYDAAPVDWTERWAEYVKLFPQTKLDLKPAQAAFAAYTDFHQHLDGEVELVEAKTYASVGGHRYVSKPDFVLLRPQNRRWTVDFKFSMSDWPPKPLLPFDDQLLGQAVTHQADGFIRVHIRWGKDRNYSKKPPQIWLTVEEQPVDPVLADEWRSDTARTCGEIETARSMVRDGWGKNTGSCHAFGRPCPSMGLCKLGLALASAPSLVLTNQAEDATMVAGMEGTTNA